VAEQAGPQGPILPVEAVARARQQAGIQAAGGVADQVDARGRRARLAAHQRCAQQPQDDVL
jgi:hypothetical protein